MKIFITGVTGLLGRHVAQLFSEVGYEIIALIRNKKVDQSRFKHDIKICYGDLLDICSIPGNLHGAEIIIHCAADTSMFARKNQRQEQINITGLQNLIAAAKKANVKKFIHISSANTIGFGGSANPANEAIKLATASFRLPYINTKIAGEEILLNEYKKNNFPVVILNPTFMLGPQDYHIGSGKLIMAAIKRKIFFYPTGGKNIVDVRDVARAILNAVNGGKTGNNYLICNENLTYKEIFTIACRYANVPAPKYRLPYFIGIIIGSAGSVIEYISGKSSAINSKSMKLAFENHYYTPEKAKIDLGFTTRPAKETIHDTINWFKNEYIQYQAGL